MSDINTETGEVVATDYRPESTSEMVMEKVSQLASSSRSNIVSSISSENLEDRLKVARAVSTSTALSDELNKIINIKDYVLQATTMNDDVTKKEVNVLRTIIIAADGKAYHAISDGIFKALGNFVGIVGQPATWGEKGLAVKVVQKQGRHGFKFLTLELA